MAKILNEKQIKELFHTKDWCLTILDFIISRNKHLPELNIFVELINNAYDEQNLRGMRYVIKDINEWAKGMPQSDFVDLNTILQDKFGEDLIISANRDFSKVNQVIRKGKISSDDEYRLLLSRVDEIYNDKSKQNEVSILNKLLARFHGE